MRVTEEENRTAASIGLPQIGRRAPSSTREPLVVALFGNHSRLIGLLALVGTIVGVSVALVLPRSYVTSAMFIPQSQDASGGGLELAASQLGLGLRPPNGSGVWGTAIYAEILVSRMLLEPIVSDTLVVPELGNRRVAVLDLLKVRSDPPAQRIDKSIQKLRKRIIAVEDKRLGAVRLTVTMPWASVSYAVAESLLSAVNRFNLDTRKTQASAERQFVERQAAEAERELRASEDRLESFMTHNRSIASAELELQRDRLKRDVDLRQSVLTQLLQKREEARIKEVRDVPVLSVIEAPRLPVTPAPRRVVMLSVLGLFLALVFGIVAAFVLELRAIAAENSRPTLRSMWAALLTFWPALDRAAGSTRG